MSINPYQMNLTKMDTYSEKQSWGKTIYDVIPGTHTNFETERAKVDLITNPYFGRMLFIDNVLQSSEADEMQYHKPFVQAALESIPVPQRILIAGGAEGAMLREVQDYLAKEDMENYLQKIVMVDWDKQLVEHMRDHEGWSHGSFDDTRLELRFENIEDYLNENTQPFDSILLDLLDVNTKEDFTTMKKIIEKSLLCLSKTGTLVCNIGSSPIYLEEFKSLCNREYNVHHKRLYIPSFQEPWFLLILSNQLNKEDTLVHDDEHKMM